VTEGYGVEWPSVFASRVQSDLASKFEVINIAAGGLNTPQEIHLFKKEALAYRPDLVILNFVLNDCDFYSSFKNSRAFIATKDSKIDFINLPINPELKRLLKSSALIYFVKQHLENLLGKLKGVPPTDYYTELWNNDDNRRKVTNGLDELAALQQKHDFDVLVIIWPLITDYRNYKFESIHAWVTEQAQQRGFSSIDLLSKFAVIPYRGLQITSEDSIHPNPLGHSIAAQTFVTWYRARPVLR